MIPHRNTRLVEAIVLSIFAVAVVACSSSGTVTPDVGNADSAQVIDTMSKDGDQIADSKQHDGPASDTASPDSASPDSATPDVGRADIASTRDASGQCKTVKDCPLSPPPIKCMGAHWECNTGKCVPTCGDPKKCDSQERYAREEMKRIASCKNDVTCVSKAFGYCPFGCYLPHQWQQTDTQLMKLIGLYNKNTCQKCQYRCAPPSSMTVHCAHKKTCELIAPGPCGAITVPGPCLSNAACRAVYGPSCPTCRDFGYQRCVPIETSGCAKQQVKARPSTTGGCTVFPSSCNVPQGWNLCP